LPALQHRRPRLIENQRIQIERMHELTAERRPIP
jgi:hypothetical protein